MKIRFSCFLCFEKFHIELDCLLYLMFSHDFIFMSVICAYIDFECLVIMWSTCFSWNIFLFYSLLEGFRTSFQLFHITSSYSSYGRVFKHTIFSNLFLKTPTHPRAVGWATMPCMLIIENLFKTCAWNGW